MSIDLDKARAARREAQGAGPSVVFGGETFALPVELPVAVIELFAVPVVTGDVLLKMVHAFLDGRYDDFMAHDPSVNDLNVFVEGLMTEYGASVGESVASGSSSKSTSRPRKRTSKPTTA